jgi:hypothetical protein
MSLTKVLLAGAAISVLTAASAVAGAMPNIHLAGGLSSKAIHMKGIHSKTRIHEPGTNAKHYTVTISFYGSFAISTAYKNPITLPFYTWYNPNNCTQPAKQKIKYTKPSLGKIKTGTSTGTISSCGSTIFTFYGGTYTLKKKNGGSDSFTGNLTAKHTTSGYNLDLVENFSLTFS